MSLLEVESLLAEISPEAPCGEDLEYDPAFGELERSAQSRPEQEMGDAVVEAQEADWPKVKAIALELFGRTKDLRVATYLARATLRTDGFVGLCDSLAVIRGMIEQYWDTVHPQLDPDDDNDPTLRVNTVASLCDQEAMLRAVREAPLVTSRLLGRFGLRDLALATGELSLPSDSDDTIPELSVIDGAFMECPIEELQETTQAVRDSIEHVGAIEDAVTAQVGAASAADLSSLVDVLNEAEKVLAERLARRGVGTEAAGEVEDAGPEQAQAAGAAAVPGQINSREDVIRMLDRACDYFARHEPSSPVPLLLQRAKRLVSKNFLEILQDLAPDGVPQAQVISGSEADEEY